MALETFDNQVNIADLSTDIPDSPPELFDVESRIGPYDWDIIVAYAESLDHNNAEAIERLFNMAGAASVVNNEQAKRIPVGDREWSAVSRFMDSQVVNGLTIGSLREAAYMRLAMPTRRLSDILEARAIDTAIQLMASSRKQNKWYGFFEANWIRAILDYRHPEAQTRLSQAEWTGVEKFLKRGFGSMDSVYAMAQIKLSYPEQKHLIKVPAPTRQIMLQLLHGFNQDQSYAGFLDLAMYLKILDADSARIVQGAIELDMPAKPQSLSGSEPVPNQRKF